MDALNPFTNRTMIVEADEFFGRGSELRELYQRVLRRQSVSLVGERRVGKSSLLNALIFQRDRPEYNIVESIRFVYMDMQSVSGCDESGIVERVLDLIEDETGVRVGSGRRRDVEPTLKEIQARGMSLVLLLDEFNILTENTNIPSTFYDLLRSAIAYRLTYVTAYREGTLDALVAGLKETDGLSPFMNIFGIMYIGPLKKDDADTLVLELSDDAGSPFSADEIDQVQRLGGYLPFYLQIAAYHAFEAKRHGAAIDWSAVEAGFRDEALHHLHSLWGRLSAVEQMALKARSGQSGSVMTRSQRARADADLRKKGILIDENGQHRVFSSVFEQLIDDAAPLPAHL